MSAPPAALPLHGGSSGGGGGAFNVLSGRPAIFLLVTLLLFLSARSDLEQPDRQLVRQGAAGSHAGVAGAAGAESKAGVVVKEQLILELSVANERLEEQNRRLRIELLALRQAARVAGLDSLLVNSTVLGVPDETLGLTEAAVQHRGQEGAGEAEAAAAQSGGTTPRRHLHLRRGGGQAALGRTAQS